MTLINRHCIHFVQEEEEVIDMNVEFYSLMPTFIKCASYNTQAKSRDHEIVRAQNKVSKGRNTPPKSCSVVTNHQVYCEVLCDRALNQMLFR